MVKSTDSRFNSQHPCDKLATVCNSSTGGSDTLAQTYMRENTNAHKINHQRRRRSRRRSSQCRGCCRVLRGGADRGSADRSGAVWEVQRVRPDRPRLMSLLFRDPEGDTSSSYRPEISKVLSPPSPSSRRCLLLSES